MEKTGRLLSRKIHERYMEQEHIIEEMADAMRAAYLPYVADSGRMTPKMEFIWFKYIQFAIRSQDEKTTH